MIGVFGTNVAKMTDAGKAVAVKGVDADIIYSDMAVEGVLRVVWFSIETGFFRRGGYGRRHMKSSEQVHQKLLGRVADGNATFNRLTYGRGEADKKWELCRIKNETRRLANGREEPG